MSEEMFYELFKVHKSLKYGVKTYTKCYDHRQGGYGSLTLFPKFEEVIDKLENNRFNIIKKSRQMGGSTIIKTTTPIKMVTSLPENPENILIITEKSDMGYDLIEAIKRNLSILPREFFGPKFYGSEENFQRDIFTRHTRKELILPNGSRVRAVAPTKDALRGFQPTWVIMDEAAYINEGDVIFSAALTALGRGGRFTLISTPNAMDRLFHRVYSQSLRKENDFVITNMLWYENPKFNENLVWIKDGDVLFEEDFTTESFESKLSEGYAPTSPWYRKMCSSLNNDERVIGQELEAKF